MLRIAIGAALAAALAAPAPAMAQMDWLTPSLENQRQNNIRRHQERMRARQQAEASPRITPAQRQAAWSRHKAEYRRILVRDGQHAADRWLDRQILAGR